MGKVGTGAKAGSVAGLAYGILDAIFALITLTIFKSDIMKALSKEITASNIPITAAKLYSFTLDSAVIGGIIGGLIIGIILGIIFAYVHNKIPSKNIVIKGEIFGVILWIIFSVLLGALDIGIYGTTYYLTAIAFDIIPLLVFGFVLGTLYNKWDVKDQPMTDEEFNTGIS
jgi:hypothetical protein